jgi:hypothetical protein
MPGVIVKEGTQGALRSAEACLRDFIAKFERKDQALIRAARRIMRRRLPTAHELVYDNYNFFVIGYGPTDKPSQAVLSLAAGANGLGLCFLHGAKLPDPKKLLQGGGRQTRFVRVPSADVLETRDVARLIDAAVAQSKVAFAAKGRGRLVIRSVSAKQRPRRKPAA